MRSPSGWSDYCDRPTVFPVDRTIYDQCSLIGVESGCAPRASRPGLRTGKNIVRSSYHCMNLIAYVLWCGCYPRTIASLEIVDQGDSVRRSPVGAVRDNSIPQDQ